MSASPTQPTNPAKRPLEDASSPSRTNDQPDAKRPALDKVINNSNDEEDDKLEIPESNGNGVTPAPAEANGTSKEEDANDEKSEVKDEQGDTVVPDANENKVVPAAIPPTTGTAAVPTGTPSNANDETAWIHIRAVISSPEAATIIGKGGENVSNIRKQSGAKCTVSDYQKGAVERILTVSGVVDAVAKAFGLIIRTLNNEPLTDASSAQSKTYPLRLLIPHILIGSIIGKGGVRIREIQEASGARLNASDSCLPLSSSTLLEQLNERFGGPAASAYATRSGGPAAVIPGGMQVIPYTPQPAGGNFGHRENYGRRPDPRSHQVPPNPYAAQQYHPHAAAPQPSANVPMHYAPQAGGYGAAAPHMPPHQAAHAAGPQHHGAPHGPPMHGAAGMAGAPLTQQIFIPNDMVGAIIGKGGQKINEIRQISGSVIKINEPQDNSNERLVTITGTEECNRMALYMLYSRLGELRHVDAKKE
ncbi:putative poly -binding protein [Eutypa lata UCREL1]|uniref:Putative poly-binding protein n=1 Tax=Eutypa lata (strain UCR-EL1) TaxID=1287681 RepID=M7TP68_EUTLA|nr:putative poly -binding protein [Eutypa lata UCREL1]